MPARKRAAVDIPEEEPRRSRRVSGSAKKSIYAEPESTDDNDSDAGRKPGSSARKNNKKTPTRPAKRAKKAESGSEDEYGLEVDEDEYRSDEDEDEEEEYGSDDEDEEEDEAPAKSARSAKSGKSGKSSSGKKKATPTKPAKRVRKEEEEDDNDDDEDEDARVTVIPIAKLRSTDGIEYADDRLHKNSLLFLKDLKANNRRPWLKGTHYFSFPTPTGNP